MIFCSVPRSAHGLGQPGEGPGQYVRQRDGSYVWIPNCPDGTLRKRPDGSWECVEETLEEFLKDEQGPDFCLRSVQNYLMSQGWLQPSQVTGLWNRQTEDVLRRAFANPKSIGTCALMARMTTVDLGPPPSPGIPKKFPTGISVGAIALIGALVAAVVLATRVGGGSAATPVESAPVPVPTR